MSAQDPTPVPAPDQPDAQRSPEELRADIETTREELGDTVEQLAAKSDVKSRAKARVEEVKATVSDKVTGSSSSEPATGGAPGSPSGPRQAATQALEAARRNPAAVGAAGAALLGYLVGRARR